MVRLRVADLSASIRRIFFILSELITEVESREEDEQSKDNEIEDCDECVDLMPDESVVLLFLSCFLGHADHF